MRPILTLGAVLLVCLTAASFFLWPAIATPQAGADDEILVDFVLPRAMETGVRFQCRYRLGEMIRKEPAYAGMEDKLPGILDRMAVAASKYCDDHVEPLLAGDRLYIRAQIPGVFNPSERARLVTFVRPFITDLRAYRFDFRDESIDSALARLKADEPAWSVDLTRAEARLRTEPGGAALGRKLDAFRRQIETRMIDEQRHVVRDGAVAAATDAANHMAKEKGLPLPFPPVPGI